MVDASEAPFKYKLLPALVQICGRCHRNVLLGVPYLCLLHPSPQTSWTHFSLSVHIFLPLMFFMSDCLSFDRGTHKSLLSVWLINELLLSQSGYFVSCQGLRAPAAACGKTSQPPYVHSTLSQFMNSPHTHTILELYFDCCMLRLSTWMPVVLMLEVLLHCDGLSFLFQSSSPTYWNYSA